MPAGSQHQKCGQVGSLGHGDRPADGGRVQLGGNLCGPVRDRIVDRADGDSRPQPFQRGPVTRFPIRSETKNTDVDHICLTGEV